jgi:large subunit ribosomal protein L10
MPNQTKVEMVDKIKTDLEAADAVWVVDYRGLSVKESEGLRANIRTAGGSLKVYKNSLTEFALADLSLPNMGEILQGPSAFIFASGDPVATAKTLKQFAKDNKKFAIKGGLYEGTLLNDKQVIEMADMPSREELIGQVLTMLDSPITGVIAALESASGSIFGLLDAREEQAAA